MRTPILIVSLSLPFAANAADTWEVIEKLNAAKNFEAAVKKCDKWAATNGSANPKLREACAEAEYDGARRTATVEGWANYSTRWKATTWEQKGKEQEGQKALMLLGVKASESEFDALARKYEGTPAGDDAKVKAAYAAFRGVSSSEDALRVVSKYPEHPEAANVTMKYLEGFVSVTFEGDGFNVGLDKAAVVPTGKQMTSNWVARYPDGSFTSWADEAKRQLKAAGLPESFIAEATANAKEGEPLLPLCFDPNAPEGWQPGVMVSLGRGSAFAAAPWDPACSDKTPPVFLTTAADKVTGMSLRPGHVMYFPGSVGTTKAYEWGDPEHPAKMLVPFQPEPPTLVKNLIGQKVGASIYLVHPIAGGMPWWWLTSKSPPGNSLQLTTGLANSPLYSDWTVSGKLVSGSALAKDQVWTLPPGEARALSPLTQYVTGLRDPGDRDDADSKPLPDPSKSGWKLPTKPVPLVAGEKPAPSKAQIGEAAVLGPHSSEAVALTMIPEGDLKGAVDSLVRTGMTLEPVRGWSVQLDDDPALESLIECVVDGVGARFLLDPPDRGLARVYAFDVQDAEALRSQADASFAFKRDGKTYFTVMHSKNVTGASIAAYHFGETSLMREYYEITNW